MYSGKIAVPPGGGGIRKKVLQIINLSFCWQADKIILLKKCQYVLINVCIYLKKVDTQ
jgi:hypothetical protein